MTHDLTTASPATADALGRAIAARLGAPVPELPHEVTQRLKSARMLALEKRRQVAVQMAQTAHNLGGTAVLGGDAWNPWRLTGSVLPLLALVAGMIAINFIQDDYRAKELADVDVELLTDDLPPAAFTDPGFAQFLKARGAN
jgi:hypothetical protein